MPKRRSNSDKPSTSKYNKKQRLSQPCPSSSYDTPKKLTEWPDESETYAASGLKRNIHGAAFQVILLMLIAFRCFIKDYFFRLATEIDTAEKFDDLVLWFKKNDSKGEIINILLLQAKHNQPTEDGQTKGTIKCCDLISKDTKNQFSLLKYFGSFKKIKQQVSSNGKFYIFTNKNFEFDDVPLKKLGSFYFKEVDKKEDLLNFEQGCHYRLVNSPEVVKQLQGIFGETEISDIEEFCQRLIFAVNQPNESELSEIVKNELENNFKFSDVDLVADSFLVTIFNWFKDKVGSYLTNEKIDELFKEIRGKFAQLYLAGITNNYRTKLKNYELKFIKDNLSVKLYRFFKQKQYSILKIGTNETSVQLCSIKVDQILNQNFKKFKIQGKIVFASLSSLVRQSNTVIEAFSNASTELLVIVRDNELNHDITSFYENLNKIIKKDTKKLKKIIFMSIKSDNLAGFDRIFKKTEHEIKYKVLTEVSKTKLLEKKVKFQGKDITLNELLSVESPTTQYLPLNDLIKRDHCIEIGTPPPESSGYNELYYMERTFFVNVEVDHEKISKMSGNDQITWLEKYPQQVTWTTRSGKLRDLKKNLNPNSQKSFKLQISYTPEKFDDFMEEIKSHKIIMISDSAGTGKSTVLTHLSKKLKQKFEEYWVVRIDLNDHTGTLDACLKGQMNVEDLLINEVLCLKSELEINLFKQFLQEKRVIIMLDGFDEISPDYEEVVIKIIEQLKEIFQLWVSTRPHLKEKLEHKFGIQCYKLRPFSEEDQRNFLRKFWNQNDASSGEERVHRQNRADIFIKTLIKHLSTLSNEEKDLLGVPLQLMMIGEIFKDEFEKFIKSTDETVSFKENLSFYDLYDKFINRKFDIFLKDKRKEQLSNLFVKASRARQFPDINKQHQYLTLNVFLPSEAKHLANITQLKTDIDEQEIISIGIVKKIVNGVPIFLHRTFAEFYFASFLIENLHIDCIKKLLLEKILMDFKFEVVWKFINSNFVKELPEQNVINQLRELINKKKENSTKDILDRNLKKNNAAILDYLLRNLNQANIYIDLKPILDFAIRNEQFEAILILLKYYDNGDRHTLRHEAALFSAIQKNLPETMKTLLKEGANAHVSKYFGMTPLHFAAKNGRIKGIEILLQNNADVNAVDKYDRTPLHFAARGGLTETVEKLLQMGALINVGANTSYGTPLHLAAAGGHTETVEKLLQNNADINAVDYYGRTPLHSAAQLGHTETVEKLLQMGALINFGANMPLGTPLHLAALGGHTETVEILLKYNADVNAVNKFNETPLHSAAEGGDKEAFEILLQYGADVNAVDDINSTLLHSAVKGRNTEIVEMLLEKGLDIHALTTNEVDVLHLAVEYGNPIMVKLLLKRGANVVDKTRLLHLAAKHGHKEIVEMLKHKFNLFNFYLRF